MPHPHWLEADINLDQLNSLVEDKDMLAENLENWALQERQAGEQLRAEQTARNLIKLGVLSDEQIAEATALPLSEIQSLRVEDKH